LAGRLRRDITAMMIFRFVLGDGAGPLREGWGKVYRFVALR
jgi:hypothetical protein